MIKKILLFVGDQWRAEALGQTGQTPVRTPALDALSAEGVTFTKHFTQCTPCGPARASLLTGLYAMNHRSIYNGTPLDRRFTNIAKEVRKAGVEPYVFGYTDTSQDPRDFFPSDPILRSYEHVLPGMNVGYRMTEEFKLWRADLKAKGYDVGDHHFDPFKVPPVPEDEGYLHPTGPALYSAQDSLAAHMCDAKLDFLKVNRNSSWLSYISFLEPHPPFVAPAPYNARHKPEDMAPPVRAETRQAEQATHPFMAALLDSKKALDYAPGYYVPIQELPEIEVQRIRATYYGMIECIDDQVARILDALRESGEIDETLVIFTVDHAEMLGDHWMWGKDGFFDGSYRIPLIVRDPRPEADGTRGRRVERFTEHVDIMPTILDWLGLTRVGSLEPKPGIPPTLEHLAKLKQLSADMIILSPLNNTKPSKWLNEKTQAPVVVLPHTVSATPGTDSYIDLFNEIIARLTQ